MAPKADLRLFQMATYSGSLRVRQVIDFSTEPPWAWTISVIAWASRSSPASRPSTSMISTAPASVGKAEAEGLLDGPDHQVVEHLERGRHDPGGDDPADGLRRRVDRVEDGQEACGRPRGRASG